MGRTPPDVVGTSTLYNLQCGADRKLKTKDKIICRVWFAPKKYARKQLNVHTIKNNHKYTHTTHTHIHTVKINKGVVLPSL